MPLTKLEYEEALRVMCPHCAAGNVPRRREDTGEIVHDLGVGNKNIHTICWSNHFRKSRFAKEHE